MREYFGSDPAQAAHAWQAPPPGWWQSHDGRWYPPAVQKKVTIGRAGDAGTLAFMYDQPLIDGLKALKIGAFRDPDQNRWLFPFDALRLVAHLLDEQGYATFYELDLQRELAYRGSGDWASDLLRATPTRLRRAVYASLARVLHPDVGGDAMMMQALNDAWTTVDEPATVV